MRKMLGDEKWEKLRRAAEEECVPLDCSRARLSSYIRRLQNVVMGEQEPPDTEEILEGAAADENDRDADEKGERLRSREEEAKAFYGPVEVAARMLGLPYEPIELVAPERDHGAGTRAQEEDDAGHLRGVDDEVTKELVLKVKYFLFSMQMKSGS
jgi:hypothetical protein